MQLDCVAAESAPSRALWSIPCARYDFSLPLINFPLSLSIWFPCMLPFLFPPRSPSPSPPCPNLCVVLPSLCSPPLSPSFCLVFSWAVCWTCCWKELCTIGQEGMKKKKKIPRPQSSQGYNAQKNHLPPKLWCPTRPTSSVSSKYRFPSKRWTSRIWDRLDWELWPFKGRSVDISFHAKAEGRFNQY